MISILAIILPLYLLTISHSLAFAIDSDVSQIVYKGSGSSNGTLVEKFSLELELESAERQSLSAKSVEDEDFKLNYDVVVVDTVVSTTNDTKSDYCVAEELVVNEPKPFECGKVYSIFSAFHSLALDVQGAATANGTKVVTYYYGDSKNNQKFWATKNGDGFQLTPLSQGTDLTVLDYGGSLIIWRAHGGNNQQFVTEENFEWASPFFRIKSLSKDYYLTSHGIKQQVTLEPKSCENWKQLWRIFPIK